MGDVDASDLPRKRNKRDWNRGGSHFDAGRNAGDARGDGLKPRRKRVTPEQLEILTAAFEQIDTPSFEARDRLAEQTGMTNREVQIWHQNRRQKRSRAAQKRLQDSLMAEEAQQYTDSPPISRPPSPLTFAARDGPTRVSFDTSASSAVSTPASSAFEPSGIVSAFDDPVIETAESLATQESVFLRHSDASAPRRPRTAMTITSMPGAFDLGSKELLGLPGTPTSMWFAQPFAERSKSAPAFGSEGTSYFGHRIPDIPRPLTNHLGLFGEAIGRPRLPLPLPMPRSPRRPLNVCTVLEQNEDVEDAAEQEVANQVGHVGMPDSVTVEPD